MTPPALRALALAALLALARGAATATECASGEHADPLVTYILTAGKAKLSAVAKAKNLYRLTVPLAAAVPTMPVMINSHPGGLEQGVLDTKRFVADWAALSEAADYRKGRYAMPQFAAEVQCTKKNVLNAANATLSPSASNVMMFVHGSPHAIVADIYHVEVAKGVATFSLRWIKAPKDTPDFGCHKVQDMQNAHHHHRPIANCALALAEDIALPGAALREVGEGATLFIKMWVFRFLQLLLLESRPDAPSCACVLPPVSAPPLTPLCRLPSPPLGAASQVVSRPRRALCSALPVAALDRIATHAPLSPPLAPARRRVAACEPSAPRAVRLPLPLVTVSPLTPICRLPSPFSSPRRRW
jgi:hypothetical protein